MNNKNKKTKNGFTLVEMLVSLAIMAIFFTAIFSLFRVVLRNSAVSEARTTAVGIANQQLEMIRNLTYDEVATTDGWPQGDIPSEQVQIIDNINYTIKTEVSFYDDPYDGLVLGSDSLGSDYKKVKVEVSWDKHGTGKPVMIYTDISPRGAEETEQPGGVLSVEVVDDNSDPIPGATVSVANSDLGINFSDTTDINGKRSFYSVTPDSNPNYSINVSMSGYTSDYTSEITATLPDPDKPHVSVYEGEITGSTFIIDVVSKLNLLTQTNSEVPEPIGNIQLDIVGKKTVGLDGDNKPVARNNYVDVTTNESGQLIINDVEWDNYTITEDSVDYDIAAINPPDPVTLDVNETKSVTISLTEHADHTLRVVVLDTDNNPVPDASVRIYNGAYDATNNTGSSGQTFFTPLSIDSFNIEIQKSGYVSYSGTIDVDGQTVREISLAK